MATRTNLYIITDLAGVTTPSVKPISIRIIVRNLKEMLKVASILEFGVSSKILQMKKSIISIFLLILSNIAFGQRFSLSELIKLSNLNIDKFDSYVTTKGYDYYKTENDEETDKVSYALEQNGSNGFASKFIGRAMFKQSNSKMISFQTNKKDDYMLIKGQLQTLGYKFRNIETNETGGTFLNYKKGEIEVSLYSGQSENQYGDKITSYEISVTRPKSFYDLNNELKN